MSGGYGSRGLESVWNKGIAARCDHRFPDEFPDDNYTSVAALAGGLASSKLPDDLITGPQPDIRPGELVWVRVSWIRSFVRQVLPRVTSPFVLVTGDSDSCIPSELGAEGRALLESPKVIRWFTQNYDGSAASGKVSPFPIGIDFHTLSERAVWGEASSSPREQEAVLKAVSIALRPRQERIQKVYVDFAWQRGLGLRHYRRYHPLVGTRFRELRRGVVKRIRSNGSVFLQTGPLPRTELWRARGAYAFVLSPHGMGLDCHRTWEALALGHIVLVPASSLDPLYAGLPVVTLNDWSDITPENLSKWLLRFQGESALPGKLTNSYWVERMRAAVKEGRGAAVAE